MAWAAVLAIGCGGSGEGGGASWPTSESWPLTSVGDDGATEPSASEESGGSSEEGESGESMPPPFDPSFIEEQVEAALADGVPGVAVAVVLEGEVVHAEGYGSGGAGVDVDAHTLFNLASVSKSVTAMALLAQRDAGLLALEDPVALHVPYFGLEASFDPASVLVEHLLLHTSGLGDYETEPFVYAGTLASSFAMNPNQPLWAPSGAIHNYSNRGYELAGLVAAEVEGLSFADTVAMRVLEPLGMDGATMDGSTALVRPHAEGLSGAEWVGPSDYLGELYQPSAGLWAGAEDLGAYVVGLLERSEMAEPWQPTHDGYGQHYGYGLFVEATEPAIAHHGGSTGGYLAHVQLLPARALGVAVVINTDAWDVSTLSNAIFDHYAGAIDVGSSDLAEADPALAPGMYADPWQLGTLQVASDGAGGLTLTFVELAQTVPMQEAWPGLWFIDDPVTGYELDIRFWPDAAGNPTHLVTRRGIAARQ